MLNFNVTIIVLAVIVFSIFQLKSLHPTKQFLMTYPKARRENFSEELHKNKIEDPYRWMENKGVELNTWIEEENKLTEDFISKFDNREKLKKILEKSNNYEKIGVPFKRGEKYYFYKNNGLQNHYVLYEKDDLDSKEKVLLDPNTFSKDGTTSMSR
jgi:prolyl oligopeptidase